MGFPTNLVLIALSFVGVGSLAYLLFSKENEKDTYFIRSQKTSGSSIKVPNDSVPVVIGRQGSNIKSLEKATNTKINFDDHSKDGETRTCYIRGSEENIECAKEAIQAIIANQPYIETTEIFVPKEASGRIIGRNGETIRKICFNSNAKISLCREGDVHEKQKIVIKGTNEQIVAAQSLIYEKVKEELEYRKRMQKSVESRSPRHSPKYILDGPSISESNQLPAKEQLVPTGSDGLLEVYASAIESPNRLWLQVKGPSTVELDRLNETMTEYYAKPEYREIHSLSEARIGQLVAAPFMYDNKYYRAEVSNKRLTEEGHELDLYYVDYGDSGICLQTHAFDLRTDYLRLRFQAIECILARVKPKDGEWDERAIDLLEELTHVALWKPLTAKINGYKERPTRAKREGSPVPCVDLYDTSGPKEIDIANELVVNGVAEWNNETGSNETSTSINVVAAGCEDSEDEAIDLQDE